MPYNPVAPEIEYQGSSNEPFSRQKGASVPALQPFCPDAFQGVQSSLGSVGGMRVWNVTAGTIYTSIAACFSTPEQDAAGFAKRLTEWAKD